MKPSRRVPAVVFTIALGLGVWGLAFTFTSATFSDGDVLSAAALNALLNDNFQAASDAVEGKLDLTGGNLTGPLGISVATGLPLSVNHEGPSGSAAIFGNAVGNTSPTVGIKNFGTGPALNVASPNGAPLFEGRLGVADPATITIKANGTIENAVGSGLPLAYGRVSGAGARVDAASTSNWTVTTDTDAGGTRYRISISGVSFSITNHTVTLGTLASSPRFASYSSVGGDLLVYVHNAAGSRVSDTSFSFAVFRPGF